MPQNKQMMRDNNGKPKLSYILDFPNSISAVAKVMEQGAEKYERNNWKKGAPITECEDSLLRHMTAFHNCENDDKESLQTHLAHVIANACFMIENLETHGGEFDDRDWENASE